MIIGTIIQSLALLRALGAVYGLAGKVAFFILGWIPAILPPVLCFLLLKFPGLWVRQDETHSTKILKSTGLLFTFLLVAGLASLGTSLLTGWVADRDPCAAFAAGVTGSVPPENCDQAVPVEKKSFWGYLFKLFVGSILVPIIFYFLVLPLYGLLYLTMNKKNAKPTILSYPVLAVLVVGQIYFWGLWAAYCSALTASYASSLGVSFQWISYLLGFMFCTSPIGWLIHKERSLAEMAKEVRQIESGGSLWGLIAIAAYVLFSISPNIMKISYGWFVNLL